MHGIQQPGLPGMGISPMMQQASPQQQQQQQQMQLGANPGLPHPQQQQQQQQQQDNISKVKSLTVPLRESLAVIMKTTQDLKSNFN